MVTTGGEQHAYLRWAPAHCGLPGNDKVNVQTKQTSSLPRDSVLVDVRNLTRAASRHPTGSAFTRWTMWSNTSAPSATGESALSKRTVHRPPPPTAGCWQDNASTRSAVRSSRRPILRPGIEADSTTSSGGSWGPNAETSARPRHVKTR